MPYRMSGSGRLDLPYVREWSVDPPRSLGVVGRPSRMSGSCREPSRMSGSGRQVLPDVWKACPDVRGCSDTLQYVR